ncbi:hypothetical protein LNQ03_19775 [Klebsiella pneumoniae subsp. pneumoniae]|nr:hypothetical protein [Klebsiella pneumoniae subsp. pneumoniae]
MLSRMLSEGYITQAQYDEARSGTHRRQLSRAENRLLRPLPGVKWCARRW